MRNIEKLNDFEGFAQYIPTWMYYQFLQRREKFIALFSGNQSGKTAGVAHSYVLRILGRHPIKEKNILPDNKIRTFRFISESLPVGTEGDEVKNTQYPAFKKFLPPSLLKKDITVRRPVMTIKSPLGGPDIFVEFSSYNQTVQNQAGIQRASIWCDESSPLGHFEEQIPRLMAADGDLIYTLTPAEMLNWEFEYLYERASTYIRSKDVVDRIAIRSGKKVPQIESTGLDTDIAILQSATDDNPTLCKSVIDATYDVFDDPDIIDIRRYGLFRQVSGIVFKDFDMKVHRISTMDLFPDGVPKDWTLARSIDYHESTPWAIIFAAISPRDEVFIFDELNPSPEKFVTLDVANMIMEKSGDYRFMLNKIDPLAAKRQTNTGLTTIDDLNRIFGEYRKNGKSSGGYWTSWDTKSTRGRDEVRKRLKNSLLCGKPFNNSTIKGNLPTIWFLDRCVETLKSMKNWKREEWASREMLLSKEEKEAPQQKWSHFPMCIEALFKEPSFRAGSGYPIRSRGTMKLYAQRP
jgi:hypothetical protein